MSMSSRPIRLFSAAALLLALLSSVACVSIQAKVDSRLTPDAKLVVQASDNDVKALIAANNRFAFDLYDQFKQGEDSSNLVFSPWSLSCALAMTYAGARGETASEMACVLHLDRMAKVHPVFATLQHRLDHSDTTSGSQMVQANALWSNTQLKKDFVKLTDAYYGGKVTELNLANGEEASRTINGWVAGKTHNKILDLVQPDDFDDLCRLVLTNAIYFKGLWDCPFDQDSTQDKEFTLSTGERVPVRMMSRSTNTGREYGGNVVTPFYQDEQFKMVELVYHDRQTSMVFILPRKGTLKKFKLTPERLIDAIGKLEAECIELEIPKFFFTFNADMQDHLKALGMNLPFDDVDADFSAMTKEKGLHIKQVVHQVRIDVNEQGSEAAAAAAVFMYARGGDIREPPSFIADRPFLFLIRDRPTGAILFLGRVMNPVELQQK